MMTSPCSQTEANQNAKSRIAKVACIFAAFLQSAMPIASSAAVIFPTKPLATSAGTAHPNLLFVLDDSASMSWDYLPDSVHNTFTSLTYNATPAFNGTFAGCFDTGDAVYGPSTTILDNPLPCVVGDPPYNSPDINRIYYDPSISYTPPFFANGSQYPNQTPTAVDTDPFAQQRHDQLGNTIATIDITSNYPDRAWCKSAADAAAGTNCLLNGSTNLTATAYKYPDATYGAGLDTNNLEKYKTSGSPYYYQIAPTRYCDNDDLRDKIGTSPTAHCINASAPSGAFTKEAKVQYCRYNGTTGVTIDYSQVDFTDCQGKQIGDYQYPRYLGRVLPAVSGQAAHAVISVPSNIQSYQALTGITLSTGGVNLISSTLTGYSTDAAAASAIASNINSTTSPGGFWEFIACAGPTSSGTGCNQAPFQFHLGALAGSVAASDVYVFPATPNASFPSAQPYSIVSGTYPFIRNDHNDALSPSDPLIGVGPTAQTATSATGTITVCPAGSCNTSSGTTPAVVTSIQVSGTELLSANVLNPSSARLDTSANQNAFATAIANAITAYKTTSGYSATASNNIVTVTRTSTGVFTGAITVTASGMTGGVVTLPKVKFTIPTSAPSGLDVAVTNITVDGVPLVTIGDPVWGKSGSEGLLASGTCTKMVANMPASAFTITCPNNGGLGATEILVEGSAAHPVSFTTGNTSGTLRRNWDGIRFDTDTNTSNAIYPMTYPVAVGVDSVTIPVATVAASPVFAQTSALSVSTTPMSTNTGWTTSSETDSFATALASRMSGTISGTAASAVPYIDLANPSIVRTTSTPLYISTTATPVVDAKYYTGTIQTVANVPMSISSIMVTLQGSAAAEALTGTPPLVIPANLSANAAANLIKARIGNGFTAYVPALGDTNQDKVYIYEAATNPHKVTAIGSGSAIPYTPLYGTITIPSSPNPTTTAVTFAHVYINGLEALSAPPLVIAAGKSPTQVATALAAALTANGASATSSGRVVTVTQAVSGSLVAITSISPTVSAGSLATLTPGANGPFATTISAINDGSTPLISGNINIAANASAGTIAAAIQSAITASGYTATVSSGVVTVTKTGSFAQALTVSYGSNTVYGTMTMSAAPTDSPMWVNAVWVNGANILSAPVLYAPGTSAATIASDLNTKLAGNAAGFTVSVSGSVLTVSKSGTAVTSFTADTKTPYGLMQFATGANPAYVTSIIVNGTNVLTSPIAIGANQTANNVATALAGQIGNGYAARVSSSGTGNNLVIYATNGANITSGPTATVTAPYSTTIDVGTWTAGTSATISNLIVDGSVVSPGSFTATTPSAMAAAIASAIGGTPGLNNYYASASGGTVTINSKYLTSAPPNVTYTFTPPANVTGVHASATATISGGEVSFGSTTVSSIFVPSISQVCTSPSSTNLLSTVTAPATSTTPLLNNIVAKDNTIDAFTLSYASNVLTITENTSGTSFGNLNGCLIQIASTTSGTLPSITTVPFSNGVNPVSSTPPSGGVFSSNTPPTVTASNANTTTAVTGTASSSSLSIASAYIAGTYNVTTAIPTPANLATAIGGAIPLTYNTASTVGLTRNFTPNSTTSPAYISTTSFTGGAPIAGSIAITSTTFTGSSLGNLAYRDMVGNFQRVDISSSYCPGSDPTYCFGKPVGGGTRYSGRSDCTTNASGCTYAEELQNFANWYAYYRTRMQTMKSGVGTAFKDIGTTYRVGFMTIHPDLSTTPYVATSEFDATQRTSWYSALYGTPPATAVGYTETPLRAALSSAGRLFAGLKPFSARADGGGDPMQYQCQKNFTLLTTDGYWREEDESKIIGITSANGTPNRIGDPDHAAGLPYKDGDVTVNSVTISSCPPGGNCVAAAAAECSNNGGNTDITTYRSCNTLADVAYYYNKTDLRSGTPNVGTCLGAPVSLPNAGSQQFDVCTDWQLTPQSVAVPQHMQTFTIGLGVDGLLKYDRNYQTSSSGDYFDIATGTKPWPQVKWNDPSGVDDLWHAAVNGDGRYFNAKDPVTLKQGMATALQTISQSIGTAVGIAVSNHLLTSSATNLAFLSTYTTGQWYGNIEARPISPTTGAVGATTWCVSDIYSGSAKTCTGGLQGSGTRTILMADNSNPAIPTFKSFDWSVMTTAERAFFATTQLSQYSSLSPNQKLTLVNGTDALLVNYLRGDHSHENALPVLADDQVFRTRPISVFGDVINSQPVYVAGAYFQYGDAGYANFATSVASRAPTLYVGANDGMLHAIDADSSGGNPTPGRERWAYVPTPVLPTMHKLANFDYGKADDPVHNDPNNHRAYVDGPIAVYDICATACTASNAGWKTILVGAFGSGARGYYALDITNPTSPALLWEFTNTPVSITGTDVRGDENVGYSTGTPIVSKDANGSWVVLLTSGYNNADGSAHGGDGRGYLYVVDPLTGVLIKKISTGVGGTGGSSTPAPSGLSKVAAWVGATAATNNTVGYIYGGDLLGNVWRFDINGTGSVVKFAELTDSNGVAQPVTTRPELGFYNGERIVIVATGKFLESGDMLTTGTQTIYGIADKYDDLVAQSATALLTGIHSNTDMVQQTLTFLDNANQVTTNVSQAVSRSVTSNPVDLAQKRGWYIDLPESGERVNIDPLLVAGVLNVASIVPVPDGCTSGHSWLTFVDYRTGGYSSSISKVGGNTVSGAVTLGSSRLGAIAAGLTSTTTQGGSGGGSTNLNVTDVIGGVNNAVTFSSTNNGGIVQGRRSGWREIVE